MLSHAGRNKVKGLSYCVNLVRQWANQRDYRMLCIVKHLALQLNYLDSIVIVIVIGCLKIEDGGNIGKTMFLCTVISTDGGASR